MSATARINKIGDGIASGFSRHWLKILSVLVGLYVGMPFAAPVLMQVGAERPANAIYAFYRPFCHQFAYRSWFLFGEQPFYEAPQFQEITGIQPYTNEGRLAARRFVGNAEMGYKVAYCERDVAIYMGVFLAGLLYGVLRRRGRKVKPLHWVPYLLIGIAPIGLDGFSQLLSQPPLQWLPYRESTPYLRTLTGFLFGIANVWLAYPYVAEAMDDIQADVQKKRKTAT